MLTQLLYAGWTIGIGIGGGNSMSDKPLELLRKAAIANIEYYEKQLLKWQIKLYELEKEMDARSDN